MKWNIDYYSERVYTEIMALPVEMKAKYVGYVEEMKANGPDLGMPHSRSMGEKLIELRLKGKDGIARVFYCTQKGQVITMLHCFKKKTQKTPLKELKVARKRLKEVRDV
jgi:phage-related protein